MISTTGEILLNYLLPEYLYKGVGKLMLARLELFAKEHDIHTTTAMSTLTAAPFYRKNGYIDNPGNDDNSCISLIKHLPQS